MVSVSLAPLKIAEFLANSLWSYLSLFLEPSPSLQSSLYRPSNIQPQRSFHFQKLPNNLSKHKNRTVDPLVSETTLVLLRTSTSDLSLDTTEKPT